MIRPRTEATVAQRFPGDPSYFGASSAPSVENLWNGSILPGPSPTAEGRLLGFLPKKPDADKTLTLGVNDTKDFGPQCPLVENDETTLLARLGGGYCQAYPDLSDGKGVPEVLLGCQIEERLNRHNKVLGAVEYASDPVDFGGHHRVRAKAAWEVVLDSDDRLSLHTSVVEDADYAPNGEQAKNLTYSLDLGWKF